MERLVRPIVVNTKSAEEAIITTGDKVKTLRARKPTLAAQMYTSGTMFLIERLSLLVLLRIARIASANGEKYTIPISPLANSPAMQTASSGLKLNAAYALAERCSIPTRG